MKKWILLIIVFLSGCIPFILDEPDEGERVQPVDINNEVTPHFEEIEALLTQVELEAGLGNLIVAGSFFNELMTIVHRHEVTQHQQARINTMAELLADTLVSGDNERIFSGSDAAAKVMNMVGSAPVGYTFVYHQIPSLVGSDELGYYVFLVAVNPDEGSETEIKETFFVTERGEILTFD